MGNKEIEIPEGYEARINGNKVIIEPKESEDERIRGAILIYLDWLDGRKDCQPKGDYTIRDMFAYLEKQKEQHAKWSSEDWAMLCDIAGYITGTGSSSGITNQERADFLYDLPKRFNFQQKPTEWSEEDENILNTIVKDVKIIQQKCGLGTNEWNVRSKAIQWIEALPERFNLQPKQEWSEDDEDKVDDICKLIEHATIIPRSGDDDTGIPPTRLNDKYKGELKAFVKSVRNRPTKSNTWKPSEEQIRAVFDTSERNDKLGSVLRNLYDDLKKL